MTGAVDEILKALVWLSMSLGYLKDAVIREYSLSKLNVTYSICMTF